MKVSQEALESSGKWKFMSANYKSPLHFPPIEKILFYYRTDPQHPSQHLWKFQVSQFIGSSLYQLWLEQTSKQNIEKGERTLQD